MKKSALSGSVPRYVCSVMLMGVGFFGVTGQYSNFIRGLSFPEDYIGSFRSGLIGGLINERGVSERSERY